ncbi:MAG: sigma-70 family RNA polymerase sigma factor [Eubacteriales bacterium]|nr:sigma-70 family RNA polymerase sigma factor [Eubacteriales bacterium]
MTKQELSQCYWLNREIDQLQKELHKLEGKEYNPINLTGMPHGGGISDPTGNIAVRRAEIHRLISLKLEECMIARARIERFISSVEDSEMRMILRLRHINGMSWEDIACELIPLDDEGNEVGKERHRTTVYRKYKKFIENTGNAHNAHSV